MQFMLMLYSDESGWGALSKDEQKQWMGAYAAYTEALRKAGAFKAANHLQSASAAAKASDSASSAPATSCVRAARKAISLP